MRVIIDRFEGEMAIVELHEGEFYPLPRALVPDAGEGDVISITIDTEATAARKERIGRLMDDLFLD